MIAWVASCLAACISKGSFSGEREGEEDASGCLLTLPDLKAHSALR